MLRRAFVALIIVPLLAACGRSASQVAATESQATVVSRAAQVQASPAIAVASPTSPPAASLTSATSARVTTPPVSPNATTTPNRGANTLTPALASATPRPGGAPGSPTPGAIAPTIRTTATPAGTPTGAPPATGLESDFPTGFIDQVQGGFLLIHLAAKQKGYGRAELSLRGVGRIILDLPTEITPLSSSSFTVSYAGPAHVEVAAEIDPLSPYVTQSNGPATIANVDLTATIELEPRSGEVRLSYNGQAYALHCTVPPENAAPVLQQVIGTWISQDWAGLYLLSSQHWHTAVTQREFSLRWTVASLKEGQLTNAHLTGPITYSTELSGVQFASALMDITLVRDGMAETHRRLILLVFDGHEWKFETFHDQ
jgi:hypothetical protein